MSILLVDVALATVAVDEAKFPDRDGSHILEHLVRYCGKFDPLPAITVSLERGTATVMRGHKYLIAARVLGRSTIRAVVVSQPSSEEVKSFLAREDVKVLDWQAIKAEEDQELNPKGWHVFFFARPLSREEKLAFDAQVQALFSEGAVHVTHDDSGPVAEFEANTPVTDAAWAAKHLHAFTSFSRERVPIISYQGRRFGAA